MSDKAKQPQHDRHQISAVSRGCCQPAGCMHALNGRVPGITAIHTASANPFAGNRPWVPCAPLRSAVPQHPQCMTRAGRSPKPTIDSSAASMETRQAAEAATRSNLDVSASAPPPLPPSSNVVKARARLRPVPLPDAEALSAQSKRGVRKSMPVGPTLGGSLKPAGVRTKSLHSAYRRRQQLEAQQQLQDKSSEQGHDPDSEGVIDYTWEVSCPFSRFNSHCACADHVHVFHIRLSLCSDMISTSNVVQIPEFSNTHSLFVLTSNVVPR